MTRAWERLTARQCAKASRWLCITPYCRNRVDRKNRRLVCCTCAGRDYANRHPIRVKFLNLKKSARRRGKEWRMESFECFRCLAIMHGYTDFQPRGADALTVDRKDEGGPYCFGNCRFITNSENARKAAEFRRAGYACFTSETAQ